MHGGLLRLLGTRLLLCTTGQPVVWVVVGAGGCAGGGHKSRTPFQGVLAQSRQTRLLFDAATGAA
jgi:hypothetical protein